MIILLMTATVLGQENAGPAAGGSKPVVSAQDLLPARLGASWKAVSPARILGKDQWSVLPDADIHAEYGLKQLITRQYSDGRSKFTAEILEMNFTSGAYGLYTFNRGSLPSNRKEFFVGRFLVSIAGDQPGADAIGQLQSLIANESGPMPTLPSQLPSQNRIPETEKYITGPATLGRIEPFAHLRDIVDFSGGVQIVSADYRHAGGLMNVMIVEYNTPQSASAGVALAQGIYESRPADEKLSRLVKRTGNYLIEVSGISNKTEAEQLIGQIKYSPRVTWEGTRLSDIPWEFRPPDAAAIEEATETAMMLLRTFYWIGILLVSSILTGIITGGSFFYYRRYRRRKLGLDDIFSDPGETVRLNLDDFLLEPGKEGIKQLGSGNE